MQIKSIEMIANEIIKLADLARLADNLKITWKKSGEDIDKFLENITIFVDRYLQGASSEEEDLLKKAITKATDNKVRFNIKLTGKWDLVAV